MALITTTGTLRKLYTPFTGLSALERSQSGVARAELVYYNVNDSWAAAGAGNNRVYQTGTIDLPKDFGYVLTDVHCKVQRNGFVVGANANSVITLFPGGALGPQINLNVPSEPDRQDVNANTAIGSIEAREYNSTYPFGSDDGVIVYNLTNKPTSLLYPFNSTSYTTAVNPATQFNWQVGEQIANQAEYDVTVYIRFLQYDIDQTYNYVIQSPQLTR
jgi:hypothetical protein